LNTPIYDSLLILIKIKIMDIEGKHYE
jgi:hypothetical protein